MDPEANYSLAMVYAQTDDTTKAYDYCSGLCKRGWDYPRPRMLGAPYLVTQRPDEAVTTFQRCIRVSPAFYQAYLNLARVMFQKGERGARRANCSITSLKSIRPGPGAAHA